MQPASAQKSPTCLLYLDSDRRRREQAEAALASHVAVFSVQDAITANATFIAEQPAVIIAVQGAHESYGDLIRQWRKDPDGADIPILVASTTTDADTIAQAYADGASDWLPAPIDFDMLQVRLPFLCRRAADIREQRQQNDLLNRANHIAQ
ncbi:MAG: hypothetical protein AAF449_09200, partial [Myxococcota bacterium]